MSDDTARRSRSRGAKDHAARDAITALAAVIEGIPDLPSEAQDRLRAAKTMIDLLEG